MKQTIESIFAKRSHFLLVAALFLAGCSTQRTAQKTEKGPKVERRMANNAEESEKLAMYSWKALRIVLGDPLPKQLEVRGNPPVGVFSADGGIIAISCEAKLPKAEFDARIRNGGWKEVEMPADALKDMHLPPNVPKDYMTSFEGRPNGKKASVFWSEYFETIAISVDF